MVQIGKISFAVAASVMAGCASTPPPAPAWAEGAVCASHDLRVMADFDAARADECRIRGKKVRVTILPEATPVNPSPWYAFRLESTTPRTVEVVLQYPDFRHRYIPKLSIDGKSWRSVDEERVSLQNREQRAVFDVSMTDSLYVAGQEIVTYRDHRDWSAETVDGHDFVVESVLGASREGRDIIKLETRPMASHGTVVLVGRQHPPEVSGAVAFKAFVEEVFSDSDVARAFREKFAIVAVPVINPDGVDGGHWRLNTAGIDLNRDWGPFTQPETQLMRDELARIDERDNVALFLDFHSTFKNVLYTQTDDVETRPHKFAERWHMALTANDAEFGLERQGGHNTDRPTSKGYVYGTYGAAAITYEMHDEAERDRVRSFAKMAAAEMMKILLADAVGDDIDE